MPPVVSPHRRRMLLASSSRCHPGGYLDHCLEQLEWLLADVEEVLFIPYARPGGASHDEYTAMARKRFAELGRRLRGVHEQEDPRRAVQACQAVFIGGGNTFVLLRDLYLHDLLDPLRRRIGEGLPYLGTSAGSNVAGLSIGVSNDMPIVHPPSFEALGAVGVNVNPHYPAAPPDPTHHGETREQRIAEFHCFNPQPVVGLHEDGMLRVEGPRITLAGERPARLFRAGEAMQWIAPGDAVAG